jgi:hypothetical protein
MRYDALMSSQGGVISRAQVLAHQGNDNVIERMLRRREWATCRPGVYVDHTGRLSPEQDRMAAVPHAAPAALTAETALLAHGMKNVSAPPRIQLAISHDRRLTRCEGIEVSRMRNFAHVVQWNRTPPQVRVEDALLVAASRRLRTSEADAVALISDACQQGLTTPPRVRDALDRHPRLRGRRFLDSLVADVAAGVHSLLEHRYLVEVERPHGLPTAERQTAFAVADTKGFRDVRYPEQRLVLELDGRLGHEWAADRWADYERDVLAATTDEVTVRAGWAQVAQPCRFATVVGRLLQARGWSGSPGRCAECPDRGDLSA